jgi:cytochrome c peroxidase
MRYSLIVIPALFVLITGGSFIIKKRPTSLEKLFVSRCGILVQKLEEFNRDIGIKKEVSNLKQDFTNIRKLYRRASVLLDYFFPYERKLLNPPDLRRVEEDNPDIIIEPRGLQVIERILYSEFSDASYGPLQQEVMLLTGLIKRIGSETNLDFTFSDALVFDALKAADIRLVSMGITGFDSPLALNSLPESAEVLQGMKDILKEYEGKIPGSLLSAATGLIDKGCSDLSQAKDFNSFDRLAFIRTVADPLYAVFVKIIFSGNFQLPEERRPLNQEATSIFSPALFDINFFSPNNRYQLTPERIELGKSLFYDSVLSPLTGRSCASCHDPAKAFTDGYKVARSLDRNNPIKRNTPTLLNAALQTRYFYDSRTATLENQLNAVVHNAAEMGGSLKESIPRLKSNYKYARLFAAAYNEEEITEYNIANAISSYVRTLLRLDSRFDRYMRGDNSALSNSEKKGFNLFAGKAKCATCHYIPLFNGLVPPEFVETESEVLGVPASSSKRNIRLSDDEGKYLFTKALVHKHAMKTPTLRNIALTAPYMHNGVYKSLDEVMDFYNKGGGAAFGIAPGNQTLPAQPLHLTKREMKNIISFLGALTDTKLF